MSIRINGSTGLRTGLGVLGAPDQYWRYVGTAVLMDSKNLRATHTSFREVRKDIPRAGRKQSRDWNPAAVEAGLGTAGQKPEGGGAMGTGLAPV